MFRILSDSSLYSILEFGIAKITCTNYNLFNSRYFLRLNVVMYAYLIVHNYNIELYHILFRKCACITRCAYQFFNHFFILESKMSSDEEYDRFEKEQRLLTENVKTIPHTPSAWDQDVCDVDEDPNPHGKNIYNFIILSKNVIILI